MTQDENKRIAGRAALRYVESGMVVGVGTGSTVAHFIDALAERRNDIEGAVSSSEQSARLLKERGIPLLDLNATGDIPLYVDGADECDGNKCLIKGGGAALTREKIIAAAARKFVCVIDPAKRVDVLGTFPLPVEVIPMAARRVMRQFERLGGIAQVREKDGVALVTDNGQHIVDVTGLRITDPVGFETEVSQWPGVVTVGVFAHQKAQVCLLATASGVQTIEY